MSFSGGSADKPTLLAHLKSFVDLTENSNVEMGLSAMTGPNDSLGIHTTRLFGIDAIFRWKPLTRGRYRSFTLQSEGLYSLRQGEGETAGSFGWFVFSQYQMSKRWFAGLSYDYSQFPETSTDAEQRVSALVTFWPSEFQTVKFQVGRTRRNFSSVKSVTSIHFQWTFIIGAHGAHKF